MHELDEERDPLQKQLSNIEQIFKEFADQYDAAAQSLRDGLVPEPIPSIQLEAARKVVSDTFAAISEAGQPFEMEALEDNASLSVAGEYLERVLQARAEAELRKKRLHDARQVIVEASALRHESDPDMLSQVQANINDINTALDEESLEMADALLAGDHVLAMLAAYARHRDTLSDLEYDTFRDAIQEHYGRPLLRDIDRGRITADEVISGEVTSDETDANAETDSLVHELHDESTEIAVEEEIQTPQYDPISEIDIDEELLEEANVDVVEDNLPPIYSEYDAGEGEDTLLPFLEGDGMNFDNDEMPEATINSANTDAEHNEDED